MSISKKIKYLQKSKYILIYIYFSNKIENRKF